MTIAGAFPVAAIIPDPGSDKRVVPSQIEVNHVEEGTTVMLPKAGVSAATCDQGPGWYYDDKQNPTQVILCAETCKAIDGGKVQINFGCQTID